MGAIESKHYSSNDYELAVKASKELECILEREFHASGRGLHEKITSIATHLPTHLIKQMRYLATIRNKLIHEVGFDSIPDRKRFISDFEEAGTELRIIIHNRRTVTKTSSGGCIIC